MQWLKHLPCTLKTLARRLRVTDHKAAQRLDYARRVGLVRRRAIKRRVGTGRPAAVWERTGAAMPVDGRTLRHVRTPRRSSRMTRRGAA